MNFTATLTAAVGVAVAALGGLVILGSFEHPPMESVQRGYRGTAMVTVYNPGTMAKLAAANAVPEIFPSDGPQGDKASEAYENVKVLGDISVGEFNRLMVSITEWISPEEGCGYCHNVENMASDEVYTKVVARRMIEMTKHINAGWKSHVASSGPEGANGVTCYTCHRGQPVPANIWFNNPGPRIPGAMHSTGQNLVSAAAGLSSLPYDPFTPFLSQAAEIRVAGTNPLPTGNIASIKQTDWTYSLMTHMSTALGVNCTYCHNSRSFGDWAQSTPQRISAWHGIRMVRDINNAYLEPLTSTFPAARLGPHGDVAKVNCATCHNGVYKPLFGANMIKDFPELAK